MKSTFALLVVVCLMHSPGFAQDSALEAVRSELTEVNRLEQEAFVSGDCEGLAALLSDDITFYANGRKLTKAGVQMFCSRIPRPFPGTGDDETQIRAISEDAGYVVKVMTFPDSDRIEVVTKVWEKTAEGWRMVHFQSTVTELKPGT